MASIVEEAAVVVEEGEEEPLPHFKTPMIYKNIEGWGPTTLPQKFCDVPYQPFGKGDRLGKAADFTSNFYQKIRDKYGVHDEDADFNLVDSEDKSRQSQYIKINRWRPPTAAQRRKVLERRARQMGYTGPGGPRAKQKALTKRAKLQSRRWQSNRRRYNQTANLEASVKVESDWRVVEQFDQSYLSKLKTTVPKPEDLGFFGSLEYYDDSYDRISTKLNKPLERVKNREHFYVTTTDDPVIEQMARERKGNVFATDTILALLMVSPRAKFSWDIVCERVGNALFFDKREESRIDYMTVDENADVPPNNDDRDSINSQIKLSIEATMINQNFSQQILRRKKGGGKEGAATPTPQPLSRSSRGSSRYGSISKKKKAVNLPSEKTFEHANPFWDDEEHEEGKEPASVVYRYRKWDIGDDNVLVARTELHGIQHRKGKDLYMTSYALNEWDPKLSGSGSWRKMIDVQRGAVLANELKKNTFKVARWTAETLLADADQMAIGYVSRVNPKEPYKHVILATQFYKPREFSIQINLNAGNMWGIFRKIVQVMMAQKEGKYVIMKDPHKSEIMIYSVPKDSFESSDEEEDSSDEDDEDDSSEESSDEEEDGTGAAATGGKGQ